MADKIYTASMGSILTSLVEMPN